MVGGACGETAASGTEGKGEMGVNDDQCYARLGVDDELRCRRDKQCGEDHRSDQAATLTSFAIEARDGPTILRP